MNHRLYWGAALAVGLGLALWWRFEPTPRPPASNDDGAHSPPDPTVPAPPVPPVPPEATLHLFATSTPWQDAPLPDSDYLQQLRALNQVDKSAALLLVEKGEEWYRDHGPAAEARRAMRVTLLVDLGRMPEARRFAREFIASYPESRYRPLVQGVTGIHPRPSPGAAR